ncbi:MAG: hypothetical protein WD317_07720 [Balneolaceae bacterium]
MSVVQLAITRDKAESRNSQTGETLRQLLFKRTIKYNSDIKRTC